MNMELKKLEIKGLDFKCLICGKEIPEGTHQIYHSGDHYTSGHYHDVLGVDKHQNAYVVREKTDIMGSLYKSRANSLLEAEKSALVKDIESSIQREEFKKIVIDKKVEELSAEYESEIENFNKFLKEFHHKRHSFIPYFVDASCAEVVMQNAEKVEKENYSVNKDVESIFKFNATMKFPEFLKLFAFLTEHLELQNLKSDEDIILEFDHFSKYFHS